MDLVFHTPWIRGISLGRGGAPRPRSAIPRMLRTLGRRHPRDFPPRYWSRLHDLELQGIELFRDVPEHFRTASVWSVLSRPWTYWRYPLGVLTPVKRYLYNPTDEIPWDLHSACAYQVKANFGGRRKGSAPRAFPLRRTSS